MDIGHLGEHSHEVHLPVLPAGTDKRRGNGLLETLVVVGDDQTVTAQSTCHRAAAVRSGISRLLLMPSTTKHPARGEGAGVPGASRAFGLVIFR